MADFTIEEVYKVLKTRDEKLPFKMWTQKKKKKKKKKENNKKTKDGHIDIYA